MVTQQDIECAEKCVNEIRFVRNESIATKGLAKIIAAHVAQETKALRDIIDAVVNDETGDLDFIKWQVRKNLAALANTAKGGE